MGAARAQTLTIRGRQGDELVDAGPFPSRRPGTPSSRLLRGLPSLRTREASLWTRSLASVSSGVCLSSRFLLGTRLEIGRGDTWGRLRSAAGGKGARSPPSPTSSAAGGALCAWGFLNAERVPRPPRADPTLHTLALASFTPENSGSLPAKASGFSSCFRMLGRISRHECPVPNLPSTPKFPHSASYGLFCYKEKRTERPAHLLWVSVTRFSKRTASVLPEDAQIHALSRHARPSPFPHRRPAAEPGPRLRRVKRRVSSPPTFPFPGHRGGSAPSPAGASCFLLLVLYLLLTLRLF